MNEKGSDLAKTMMAVQACNRVSEMSLCSRNEESYREIAVEARIILEGGRKRLSVLSSIHIQNSLDKKEARNGASATQSRDRAKSTQPYILLVHTAPLR